MNQRTRKAVCKASKHRGPSIMVQRAANCYNKQQLDTQHITNMTDDLHLDNALRLLSLKKDNFTIGDFFFTLVDLTLPSVKLEW